MQIKEEGIDNCIAGIDENIHFLQTNIEINIYTNIVFLYWGITWYCFPSSWEMGCGISAYWTDPFPHRCQLIAS